MLWPTDVARRELLEQRTYGPAGVVASRISQDLDDWSWGQLPDDNPVATLAQEYEAAWTSNDPARVVALYEPDAVLLDGVVGVELEGADAIGDHAASAPDGGRPFGPRGDPMTGLYVASPRDGPATVTLVFGGEADQPCPGRVAVDLQVRLAGREQPARITNERRFRDVAEVRRRVPGPRGGWWEELEPVEPTQVRPVSERVQFIDQWIEVVRLNHDRIGLLRWALARFDAAGLPLPELRAVTFETGTPRCAGVGRRALSCGTGDAELVVCLTDEPICLASQAVGHTLHAQTTILHELAHVWIESNLDDVDRSAHLAQTGLSTWMGADVAWSQRGGERAAEVLMWGLLDADIPLVRLDTPSCDVLERDFPSLTGADPLGPRCRS